MFHSLDTPNLMQRNPPTLAPPGAVVDYNSPDDIGIRLTAAGWITLIAALLCVGGRLINKLFLAKSKPGYDDYFSIFALLFAIARVGCNSYEVWTAGVGRHVWDIRPKYLHVILNVYEIGNVVYLIGIMFAKLSLLALFLYIFGTPNRTFSLICYGVGFAVVSYCGSCAIATLFACSPESATWNRNIPGKCIDLIALDITIGALNLFTDSVIFILPIPILLRLQTSRRTKIELLIVFGTGLFVIATTITRLYFVVATLKDFDQTRAIIPDMTWLTVELNIGIMCGCLPLLRPLLRYISSSRAFASLTSSWSRLLSSQTNRSAPGPMQDSSEPYSDSQTYKSGRDLSWRSLKTAKSSASMHRQKDATTSDTTPFPKPYDSDIELVEHGTHV